MYVFSALGRRSRVRGSVVGPFSHVAILLSCVVSSEFKHLWNLLLMKAFTGLSTATSGCSRSVQLSGIILQIVNVVIYF